MRDILGKAKTVRELLKGVKYSIDYYQREYKWHGKQIGELIHDLWSKFSEEHDASNSRGDVANYPHYFLGSIIVSKKDNTNFIVDGQQRLTSLTLLLLALRKLQKAAGQQVSIDELIVSEKYGQLSFNLHVEERIECMEALYDGRSFDPNGKSESVHNLYRRYTDLEQALPEDLAGHALPYFIDWLLENVHLVEITAYSDDDAYTIFETMNDRGLSLSPTDMLKGYLLTNIADERKRESSNNLWRKRVQELQNCGKEVEPDFFKAWLRSQYAQKIRERKKNARPEDFDRIGTEYHRWLREASDSIGLNSSDDFFQFIRVDFDFYSKQHLRIVKASRDISPGLEHILYNAHHGFTLQNLLLLAPLKPDDDEEETSRKLSLVSRFADILITRRLWNFRSIAYSTMQYAMFLVMRDIKGMDSGTLAETLRKSLEQERETFATNDRLRVHQQNRYSVHRLLARLTDFVEVRSGLPSRYMEYVSEGKNRYEIEHIWADHPERHSAEFAHPSDFAEFRNRVGGLLLLPKSFNASYGDLPFENKVHHYYGQNLLARSLHPRCYEHNPGFIRFVAGSGLPFRYYDKVDRAALEERGRLYQAIAERLWDANSLT